MQEKVEKIKKNSAERTGKEEIAGSGRSMHEVFEKYQKFHEKSLDSLAASGSSVLDAKHTVKVY